MPADALAAEPAPASARRTARPMLRPTRSQHDLMGQTRRTALPFRIFCGVFVLVLCGNAVAVYFASHSIRLVVVTTLACSLLLQIAYFASVLFLIWRSGCASRAGQRAEHFGSCKEVRSQPADHDEVRNESSDVPQLGPAFPC
ncbi:exopolysaccharide production repressor protein [Mesorhizobium sp. AR02]|uniref:exopolysaccharide production repressor protein n=1 Tax=Mesorhizobium sp. AR02 TaxID=2865837 RepID=UPI0029622A05|nr:exopolysaccharide production repressor protein [Mesorhizobium sp. AR02]